jgi:glycosyltransferase involved in cell wall biosynthesis
MAAGRAKGEGMTTLSIVSGTYNRLDYLRGMAQSVRDQIPSGIDYELVIVDGGSTDGTLEWCRAAQDIVLIEQGELLGAIRAFDAGCEAARGEYVCLLNDDVLVHDGTLVRALAYLDSHPDCGAVAFGDNRQDGTKTGETAQVGNLRGIAPDGSIIPIAYAQCGMFRKWLGDLAGWWGSHDESWGKSDTYGGDNRLSARIWELGYTVDVVEGCAVTDRIAHDGLREHNARKEAAIGSAYMRRWGAGVRVASEAMPDQQQREHLRILYAPLFSPGYGRYKRGLCDAFARLPNAWVYELDLYRQRDEFIDAVSAFQPHLILLQCHDPYLLPLSLLAYARTLVPSALVVNWNGDVYYGALTSPDMLAWLKGIDLQLVVNADVLPVYAQEGIAAAYWQIGFEPVPDSLPEMPAHDILFMANAYSGERKALGGLLRDLAPNVGIYGQGWDKPTGNTFYDFARGAALYRNCKIAIGDNQYGDKGFVSNRLFEALANGAFLLHQTIPGLEEMTGLVDGVHYVAWDDEADLRQKVTLYLAKAGKRRTIAQTGEAFVREHHSFDVRVRQLFEIIEQKLTKHEDARASEQRSDDGAAPVAATPAVEALWMD